MDVTGRDGAQDSIRFSAYLNILHILYTHQWFDLIEPGWHTNPHDQVVLDFFRDSPEIRDKFVMLSPLYRQGRNDADFDAFIHDDRFGRATFLIKGRWEDAQELLGMETQAEMLEAIRETVRRQKEAMPGRPIGIAAEQGISGWFENRDYMIACCRAAHEAGAQHFILPDTDGVAQHHEVQEAIEGLAAALGIDPGFIQYHGHRDSNVDVANAMQAVRSGVGAVHVSFNSYGERAGNTDIMEFLTRLFSASDAQSLPQCGLGAGGLPRITAESLPEIMAYARNLHQALGTQPGDKAIGSVERHTHHGGIHVNALVKRLREFGVLDDYHGSYSAVPPSWFGNVHEASLSPVSGRANVLFIGLRLFEKLGHETPALDDELFANLSAIAGDAVEEVKRRDFAEGYDFSGINNANAELLIAAHLGLRSFKGGQHDVACVFEADNVTALRLQGLGGLVAEQRILLDLSLNEHLTEPAARQDMVRRAFSGVMEAMQGIEPSFGQLKLENCTVTQVYAGGIEKDAASLLPRPEKILNSVTLNLARNGEPVIVNGVGADICGAIADALNIALDYQLFRLEQERLREGVTPLVDARNGGWDIIARGKVEAIEVK